MTEILFSNFAIAVYAILFGSTMKIADLLGEHGLRWFKRDALVFGTLFGSFGALMILSNNVLANFFIAMLIHWTLRFRIDSLEHGIAGAIMYTTFVLNLSNFIFNPLIFWTILIPFSIFGLINDAADRKEVSGFVALLGESQFFYIAVPLILLALNTNYWIIMVVSGLHIVSYEATKLFFKKMGYH